jgi:Fe2+ or Zn2+ uptake regulation protein
LKITQPRLLVLNLLQELGGHRSRDDLVRELKARGTSLPRASVYHIIDTFVSRGVAMLAERALSHNRRIEQRKGVKFNHLVANCLIFYDVHVISEALQKLNQEGAEIGEQVAALSPYIRQHIHRFGRYQLDLTQPPPPLNYDIRVITSKKRSAGFVASEAQKKAKARQKKKKSARQMRLFA